MDECGGEISRPNYVPSSQPRLRMALGGDEGVLDNVTSKTPKRYLADPPSFRPSLLVASIFRLRKLPLPDTLLHIFQRLFFTLFV